MDLHPMTKDYN